MIINTSSKEFFDAKYAVNADPWNFASSPYEIFRYETTIRALTDRRYRRAFEPGCSVGVLTLRLANLCDSVDAMDISAKAVDLARERCRKAANVQIVEGALPRDVPTGMFDLIVLSEIGYYFEEHSLRQIVSGLVGSLTTNGILLAVHWLGESPDHKLAGDTVHCIIRETSGLSRTLAICRGSSAQQSFRLERWERQ